MAQILVIIRQNAGHGLALYEALSAVMVLATYDLSVQLYFVGDGMSLLNTSVQSLPVNSLKHTASPHALYALLNSFEFYDFKPVWVDGPLSEPVSDLVRLLNAELKPMASVDFNPFNQVLMW